jgi:hypothetical protein
MIKKVATHLAVAIVGIALGANIFFFWNHHKMTKVHKLQSPLLLASEEKTQNYHLLPKGTTLYFDQSYPEGFTRYKIYINIDRTPLKLSELNDPTSIFPIDATAPNQDDLKKLLKEYPISKSDLQAILKSGQLSKDEIKEVLSDFLR